MGSVRFTFKRLQFGAVQINANDFTKEIAIAAWQTMYRDAVELPDQKQFEFTLFSFQAHIEN